MITANLINGQSPQLVQIVVDEIGAGVEWSIVGVLGELEPGLLLGEDLLPSSGLVPEDSVFTDTGYTWQVPGGSGVGTGGQVVLVDNRSPGNQPYVYILTTSSGTETSNSVIVPFVHDIVLQTLDGQAAVDVPLMADSLGMELPTSAAGFRVPGRARRVIRYDVLGDVVSSFTVEVPMADTPAFRRVLTSGAPIVYRFGGDAFDMAPVGVIAVNSVSSQPVPTARLRWWTLGYELVDDPNLEIPLGAFSWDQVDAALSGSTWNEFNTAFTGLNWDTFDTTEWSTF